MSVLELERSGAIATVWLANPDRRNAVGADFFHQLPTLLERIEQEPEIRAVVLCAQGKDFSVGLDLKSDLGQQLQAALAGGLAAEREQLFSLIRRWQKAFSALASLSKPVIAAVHGNCIGAGLDLISACDIRFAAEQSVFSLRETKMAIVADLGSLQRLSRIIGQGHLREMALTGGDWTAAEALRIGLINRVCESPEATLELAQQRARQIAENSPLTVRGVKYVLEELDAQAMRDNLEKVALWNAAFLPSEDLMEAFNAFFQKRPARFQGR